MNADAQWFFIVGENSTGKTTVLQSMALSLTGEIALGSDKTHFNITFQSNDDKLTLNYWDRGYFDPFMPIACYGASRLRFQTDCSKEELTKKSTTTYSLFHDDGILLNIEYELFKWFYKKDTRFETVITILKKILPNIQDIVLDEKDDRIYYIEKMSVKRLIFKQLDIGCQSLIGMIGDMILRLFKTQKNITNPNDLAGIVLIDGFDLYLHPKWQRHLPALLSEIFPNVQFIASTYSEIPLLGAPENSVFFKTTRNIHGVTVHKVDIDLSNLLPNHLLTSELFDMDINDIRYVLYKPKPDLKIEDRIHEIEDPDTIRERLKNYKINNAKFPNYLFE
jgi:predicted ATP-binding protein involved in virulence